MANQFNTNPFTLTTTMPSSFRNTVTNVPQPIIIREIQWTGGTAAQNAVIQDGHGNQLFSLLAVTGADSFITPTPKGLMVADFQVTTLASGTLIIYT
jgi:hypothetical protein